MKVMHGVYETAGQNCYSVSGLNAVGIEAETVLIKRNSFSYPYDVYIDVKFSDKKRFIPDLGKLSAFFIKSMFKYDVFHFHSGISTLINREIKIYRLFKKKLFVEFHGSDVRDYKKFSEINKCDDVEKNALPEATVKRNRAVCEIADGIILHDDELIPYLPEVTTPVYIVPLRVIIGDYEPHFVDESAERITIVHAPSNKRIKGTEYVLKAVERLQEKYNNIDLILVENKTKDEAKEIYKKADIIVDQLILGTYGVFSIEGMALGKPVVTYISEEMLAALPKELPIVSANKFTLYEELEKLVLDGHLRKKLGENGRKYAETYHDNVVIAQVLKNIYEGKWAPAHGREAFERVKQLKLSKERELTELAEETGKVSIVDED